jgi:hypothetical protein
MLLFMLMKDHLLFLSENKMGGEVLVTTFKNSSVSTVVHKKRALYLFGRTVA